MLHIIFDAGSVLVTGTEKEVAPIEPLLTRDERVEAWRASACQYHAILEILNLEGIEFKPEVRVHERVDWCIQSGIELRDYQQEAVEAWDEAGRRGVIILPTGVGKSIVGVQIIETCKTPTLVVLPTIDLMNQWAMQLEKHFDTEVGMLGGGSKEVRDLTVSTYDSATIMMEYLGDRFGLIIFDEVHHLPGQVNRCSAEMSCAPYRLGLTATIERDDGGEEVIYDLLGPLVYRREIDEFEEGTLSEYETVRIGIELDPDEQEEYDHNRGIYKDFLKRHRIFLGSRNGWNNFLRYCATTQGGPEAMAAYQRQKQIAGGSRQKLRAVWRLLKKHAGERIIIFTALNALAYDIGEQFLLPVITHLTKAAERKAFMERFRDGSYSVLVTSRVLNEGIDVPEASVGIIVSGSGSVREHVQRLGRILRPRQGKQAMLYEIISAGTGETYTSDRRRQHRAYQRPS